MSEPTGTLTLHVERMSYGADAIAHTDEGKTVFVSGGAVPGDVVTAEVTRDKGSFAGARLVSVVEPSPDRATSPCPYADICGGCPWAHLSRDAQLAEKRANVVKLVLPLLMRSAIMSKDLKLCSRPSPPSQPKR